MKRVYTDSNGFEIQEECDAQQNRTLTGVRGSGSFFAVPDGICALARDAFSEVTETLSYVFIPKSVTDIPLYTFAGFRGALKTKVNGKELHELHILCEAESRPEGFAMVVQEETFEEDYEFYTEYKFSSWCGHGFDSGKASEVTGGPNCYGIMTPHVQWGVSPEESLRYRDL